MNGSTNADDSDDRDIEDSLNATAIGSPHPPGADPPGRRQSSRKSGPGSRFVALHGNVLHDFFAEHGFRQAVQGNEIVYVREHHSHPAVKIKVYTTLPANGTQVRDVGQDAIRVVAAYESGKGGKAISPRKGAPPSTSFGLYKATKILRTGSEAAILDRMLERMREAYGFSNEWLRNHWREVNG